MLDIPHRERRAKPAHQATFLRGRLGKDPPRARSRALNRSICVLAFLATAFALARPAPVHTGRIVDAAKKTPVAGAVVTLGDRVVRTDSEGRFEIGGPGDTIGLRAHGYLRRWVPVAGLANGSDDVELRAFRPKGLYLSFYGVGNRQLRESALRVIKQHGLNALVIDVKGDRGMIAYKSSVALARQAGAQKLITIPDPAGLVDRLHRDHLYVVARIVVFKDNPLATARPELAVKHSGGAIYSDREKLAWTDPFDKEVWNYNIAIAVEAARLGFDEIQFDYVRFPAGNGLAYSAANTMANRIEAITGFLAEARKQLAPYNVFLAADIFGYVLWNSDDTGIGQRVEELAQVVDYISPMLYPSCFKHGIPGYPDPVAHPYQIVYRSLEKGRERAGIAPIRFRPWLQGFRDYAFDRRPYRDAEIGAQVKAAEDFGTNGWMLWNPRNVYFASNHDAGPASCSSGTGR